MLSNSTHGMKIGIDSRLYSSRFTGIGRYVKELVDRVVIADSSNSYVLFFNEPEFTQYVPPASNVKKVKVDAKHYSLKEQLGFKKNIEAENLDLMHFTHFNAPILYTKPSIVTIHDLTLHKFPGQNKQSLIYKLGYRLTIQTIVKHAKRIITVSEFTKADTVSLLGVKPSKIEVIYEGISPLFEPVKNTHILSETRKKYGIEKPYFFYTGAWRAHKNLVNLIRAFNMFRNNTDSKMNLVLGGSAENSDYAQQMYAVISELGLASHVIMPGHIDEEDMPSLYSDADLFVFPSLYEGFGLPPLEAMACGTPVACSNVTSIPEVCGTAAEYFDPENLQSMMNAFIHVSSSEERQKDLIAKGLEHVKHFSWDKMAKKTLELYHIVGGHGTDN